jgi:NADH-quinone oxidoreductase subunit J
MLATILFIAFAGIAVISSILMITRRNPLVSALFLVAAFCAIGGIYFMLNAPLIGIFQVIVYAGAIMVLIIFTIMLLNLSRPPGISFRLFFVKILGTLLAVLFLWIILSTLLPSIEGLTSPDNLELMKKPDFPHNEGTPQSVAGNNIKLFGWTLLTDWIYPFEIVSVILLVGIVGAVLFSRKEIK